MKSVGKMGMAYIALVLVVIAVVVGLVVYTINIPTAAEELREEAELAQICRDNGGKYVFDRPPGYTTAHHHCVFG